MNDDLGKVINLSDYFNKKDRNDQNDIDDDMFDIPSHEEFFAVMDMTTDDIVAELVFRLQTNEKISDLSTDVLVSEIAARLIKIEDLCVASVINNLQNK